MAQLKKAVEKQRVNWFDVEQVQSFLFYFILFFFN